MTDTDAEGDATDAENAGIPDDADIFPEGTFNDWLGFSVEEYDDGRAVVSVEFEDFKRNPGGVMHGGVTATLIDIAGGVAIRSRLDALGEGDADLAPTTDLDVSYLRPITDTAYATGEVARLGKTNAVVQVEVESTAPNGERKKVAVGTVTYLRP